MNRQQAINLIPPTERDLSDATMVSAARGGDKEAFSRLVERHFGMVWAIAYSRLARPETADDVAQEVFLMALLHLNDLLDANRFAGWLSQITHHRAVDWLRRKQSSSRLVAMVPIEDLAHRAAAAEESAMDQEERHQAVRDAVFALPEDQREVVLLHFAEGLSKTQIAQRLEVHPGTVARRLEKALVSVRTALDVEIQQAIRPMRSSRQIAARTAVLAGTVAAMSSQSKAALLSAGGAVPKLAAAAWISGTGKAAAEAFGMGAGVMATTKAVGVVAAVLLALGTTGVAIYEMWPTTQRSPRIASTPATQASAPLAKAPAATPPASIPAATASELQMITAAQAECFPPEVVAYLMKAAPEAAKLVDPTGALPVLPQATGVDHAGTRWVGTLTGAGQDNGDGRLEFGNTSATDLAGVILADQQVGVVPLQRTRNPEGAWGPYRMWIQLDKRQIAEGHMMFGIIMRSGTLGVGESGVYKLQLANWPGPECVQQLILVTPARWRVRTSSEPEAAMQALGNVTVHLWQKRLAPREGFIVNVELLQQQQ